MSLASNEKPSNLNAKQYKIVRNQAFKKWFGDWENAPEKASKVVDENGEPLVLHRGNLVTQEDLGYTFNLDKNFLKKESGNKFGFFFTNEIDIAKKYMLVDHFDEIRGGSITSVFMKSNKILNLLDFDLKIGQDNFVQGLIKKGINFNNGYNYLESKILDFNPDNYKYWGYNVFDYFDVFPELRNLFMENGFNSVVFYEMSRTYSKYKVYVAFESKQVKLADGSNTTFEDGNPDIRYNKGGNLKYDKSGNVIGEGGWNVQYSVMEFEDYPQVTSSVSESKTSESVYVTYTNKDNNRFITVRFSNHENNAVRFGDQLDGFRVTKNEVLAHLGLKKRVFIPKKKFLYIATRQVKKKEVQNYEEADKTMRELYALGVNADISSYMGKIAQGSTYLILGEKVEEHQESRLDALGQLVPIGNWEYFKQGGNLTNWNYSIGGL